MRFNVGDRLKNINCDYKDITFGDIVTVESYCEIKDHYTIKETPYTWYLGSEYWELVEPKVAEEETKMIKTLSELEEENAYKLGDVYKCIYSIDNNSDNPIYKEGGIYPVIIGRNGNLGIKDDLGEISMCRTGSSKFKLVEPKVAENRFDKFTNRELGFMAGRTLGKINNQYMIELLRRMEEGVE